MFNRFIIKKLVAMGDGRWAMGEINKSASQYQENIIIYFMQIHIKFIFKNK
jgi:hypothetical protein